MRTNQVIASVGGRVIEPTRSSAATGSGRISPPDSRCRKEQAVTHGLRFVPTQWWPTVGQPTPHWDVSSQ